MIRQIDLEILYLLNRTIAHPTLDVIMSALTSVWTWMPVYIIAGVYLLWKRKLQGLILLLASIALVILCDQLAQHVMKPLFARSRPCAKVNGDLLIDWIRLPIGERFGYSFPSSHALNNAAVAVFFSHAIGSRKLFFWLIAAALLIGISRIYLGLHYPSDVLGGIAIGAVLGVAHSRIFRVIIPESQRIVRV